MTVRDICDAAGISRKTFYVYFHDRRAIVERAFARDVMRPSYELLDLLGFEQVRRLQPNMHERQFRAIGGDGDFYASLAVPGSGGDEAFLNAARNGFYDMNRAVLERAGYSSDERRLDYVADYFASAKAHLLEKWILGGYDLPVAQLARLYEAAALPFWQSLGKTPGGGVPKPFSEFGLRRVA